MISLDRFNGSCNVFDILSSRIYVPNKTEDVNLDVFNMITGINKSKTITKHIFCNCKCKFDGRKFNLNQEWSKDKSWCECKTLLKNRVRKKDRIWNPITCARENDEYLVSIVNDKVVKFDEIIELTKR